MTKYSDVDTKVNATFMTKSPIAGVLINLSKWIQGWEQLGSILTKRCFGKQVCEILYTLSYKSYIIMIIFRWI